MHFLNFSSILYDSSSSLFTASTLTLYYRSSSRTCSPVTSAPLLSSIRLMSASLLVISALQAFCDSRSFYSSCLILYTVLFCTAIAANLASTFLSSSVRVFYLRIISISSFCCCTSRALASSSRSPKFLSMSSFSLYLEYMAILSSKFSSLPTLHRNP